MTCQRPACIDTWLPVKPLVKLRILVAFKSESYMTELPHTTHGQGGINTLQDSFTVNPDTAIGLYHRVGADTGNDWGWEVVVLKRLKKDKSLPSGAVLLPAGSWVYPSAARFGKEAWALPTFESAQAHFEGLRGVTGNWAETVRQIGNQRPQNQEPFRLQSEPGMIGPERVEAAEVVAV